MEKLSEFRNRAKAELAKWRASEREKVWREIAHLTNAREEILAENPFAYQTHANLLSDLDQEMPRLNERSRAICAEEEQDGIKESEIWDELG
ncbi:hypothetical protein PITC_040440 [Penicillium italicum]|uniref:Tubulin-specific chaperone A n=1 Tax=Penicillium italicum TaxID=40296 RepID=A0A0A2KQ29_PENIT|nr:hypothetical protein PITC_040440 [Penicillium italicum]